MSFHVGSGCGDPNAFAQSASDALQVFKWAAELGIEMKVLDIGGGFQGTDHDTPTLSQIAQVLIPVLERFPAGTEFMAEPGRYFAMKSHTLACNIFARRVVRDVTGAPARFIYYISDGVYQSFNCIFFDHQHPEPKVLPRPGIDNTKLYPTMIFGPTCDSLDCITKEAMLPELGIGDYLYFENMGAYTTAAHSSFNGFTGAKDIHWVYGPKFMDSFMEVFTEPEIAEAREPDKGVIVAVSPAHEATVSELVHVAEGC